MITAPKRLLRQRSSTGYRTTVKGHELLAKNAVRDTVLVLRSGVQLERLSTAKTDDSQRLTHVSKLKNSSEAQSIRWNVKVVSVGSSDDETSSLAESTTWSLRTVPRGIRDALCTGLFLPGTVWRIWVPGEHAGSLEPQEYESGLRIIDVTVKSLDERHGDSILSMILSLCAAILSALFCFLTDYYRRVFSSKTSLVRGSTRPQFASALSLEDASLDAQVNTTKVQMDFIVDLEELEGSVLEIVEQGKCAHWFLKNLDAFAHQGIAQANDQPASVSVLPSTTMKDEHRINASSSDLDLENEHVLKYIQKIVNSSTAGTKYRVFLNVSNFSLLFSADARTLEDKALICIGHVIKGTDALIALNNCDDGGIVSSILQL